jgi:hypothetical protein
MSRDIPSEQAPSRENDPPRPDSASPSSQSGDRLQETAVASLVIGIFSSLFCAGAGVGAITGIVLGIIALRRAVKKPEQYSGKKVAVAGIVVNSLSLLVALPLSVSFLLGIARSAQLGHETVALDNVRKINAAERTYMSGTGNGQFGDFKQLANAHLIDATLASGEAGGYEFTCVPLNVPGKAPMYDLAAKPTRSGILGNGNKSFGSNERMIIYATPGIVDLKGTAEDRRLPAGVPTR